MKALAISIVLLTLVSGCASITKEEKKSLAAPVDCSTAEGDLRVLNSEKANIGKEIADGASGIIPIGLVVHLIERDEEDTLKVGFGEYNKALDTKIAEIKKTCNIK